MSPPVRSKSGPVILLLLIFFYFVPQLASASPELVLDQWEEWRQHPFHDTTSYTTEKDGSLKAQCARSASAYYRDVPVDLTKTPVLHWSWKVDGVHPELHEREKSGDDYPARIYVVYAPSELMPWRTVAIDYVWSNNQPEDSVWPNAFTGHAMMVALRSGAPKNAGKWLPESRNVRDDFRKFFNLDIEKIDGVALMTDCDNAGLPMTGYYKNIRFSAE